MFLSGKEKIGWEQDLQSQCLYGSDNQYNLMKYDEFKKK